ncbi:MAG: nitrite reductase large subunit, partial [Pseudomonadota bacterium]
GTQDSTALGIAIEKRMWGSWTPHKVKMAVSGCPRNCAEATCKDVGVICVDSGFEVSVAGAAGMDVKETEALGKAVTEEEALDLIVAFVQLYRENAKYLDRPYKWVAKVGLDWVKERVVEDLESRQALIARFDHSQSIYQTDPWAARANDETTKRWSPMADLTLEAAE